MTQNHAGGPPGEFRDTGRVAGGKSSGSNASEFAGVGLQFAACIIGGLFLGQWLDRRLGTGTWLAIGCMFAGGAAGFYSMYRKLMKAQARDDAAQAARRESGQ